MASEPLLYIKNSNTIAAVPLNRDTSKYRSHNINLVWD